MSPHLSLPDGRQSTRNANRSFLNEGIGMFALAKNLSRLFSSIEFHSDSHKNRRRSLKGIENGPGHADSSLRPK
jgi:hypothetical protein